jgi:hypothetical protein
VKFSEIFESKTCGRCGGTGRYSWNAVDGSRCYGCNGIGSKYTKPATVARQAFDAALTTTADTLKVGDTFRANGVTFDGGLYRYWARVLEVIDSETLRHSGLRGEGEVTYTHHGGMVQRRGTSVERVAILQGLVKLHPKAFQPGTKYTGE